MEKVIQEGYQALFRWVFWGE